MQMRILIWCSVGLGLLFVMRSVNVFAQAADQMTSASTNDVIFLDDLNFEHNYFEHTTKLGAIFTTGNTESFNISGASNTVYRVGRFANSWRLGAYFNRITETTSSTEGVGTIANYIYGVYRMDYYFLPLTTVFVGGGGYTDEVKGIDLAWQGFSGVSHYFLRSQNVSFNVALGYNFTYENRIEPDPSRDLHSVMGEISYIQRFNDYVSFSQGVSALESINETDDFRVNSDTELTVKLYKIISFVAGYHIRFDNEPTIGKKKLDTIADISLAVTIK